MGYLLTIHGLMRWLVAIVALVSCQQPAQCSEVAHLESTCTAFMAVVVTFEKQTKSFWTCIQAKTHSIAICECRWTENNCGNDAFDKHW